MFVKTYMKTRIIARAHIVQFPYLINHIMSWARNIVVWWRWTCLWTLEFVDFQIKHGTIKLNQHFVGILNSWIVFPTKLNVQRIKMISQYMYWYSCGLIVFSCFTCTIKWQVHVHVSRVKSNGKSTLHHSWSPFTHVTVRHVVCPLSNSYSSLSEPAQRRNSGSCGRLSRHVTLSRHVPRSW